MDALRGEAIPHEVQVCRTRLPIAEGVKAQTTGTQFLNSEAFGLGGVHFRPFFLFFRHLRESGHAVALDAAAKSFLYVGIMPSR